MLGSGLDSTASVDVVNWLSAMTDTSLLIAVNFVYKNSPLNDYRLEL